MVIITIVPFIMFLFKTIRFFKSLCQKRYKHFLNKFVHFWESSASRLAVRIGSLHEAHWDTKESTCLVSFGPFLPELGYFYFKHRVTLATVDFFVHGPPSPGKGSVCLPGRSEAGINVVAVGTWVVKSRWICYILCSYRCNNNKVVE